MSNTPIFDGIRQSIFDWELRNLPKPYTVGITESNYRKLLDEVSAFCVVDFDSKEPPKIMGATLEILK